MAKKETAPVAKKETGRKSLKVIAMKDGFYPKDVRRRRGSIFTLADASHFSDHEQEKIRPKRDGGRLVLGDDGKPIMVHTQQYGWMAWAEPDSAEHVVTGAEAAQRGLAEQANRVAGNPSDQSVI